MTTCSAFSRTARAIAGARSPRRWSRGADEIALKPRGVSHERAAAAATTGLTAIQSIRDLGRLAAGGGRVLVTGVSGGVGSISDRRSRGRSNATVTAVGSGAGRRAGAAARRRRGIWDRATESLPPADSASGSTSSSTRPPPTAGARGGAPSKPGGAFVTTLPSAAFAVDKVASLLSRTRVHFVNVKSRAADLALLAAWLAEGLEVPLAGDLPVRDVARGLARLQKSGGRIAVQVADGF